MAAENKKAWYLRKEVIGTAVSSLSSLLLLFPQHTTAHVVGAGLGIALGAVTTILGLKKGYEADNLPSGITKVMDAIPDSITGVKGSFINKK